MKIRKLLAAALVLIMVLAAVPVLSLAEGVRVIGYESRQMGKLEAVWAALEAAEAEALSSKQASKAGVIQTVYETALNLRHVDKDSFSDFTKDGFFFTVDGMQCGYNYRVRNELKAGAAPIPQSEQFVFVKGTGEQGKAPNSPHVLLVAPYYGQDASFTNQYKNEAQSIANTTGGNYTLIQSAAATGPAIAQNITNKGVVIYDSHGVQSGTSSYLCLTTNSGITVNDYNNGWAVASGSSAFIDGRYIRNHINGNLGNCFVWMAICEGMKRGGQGTTGSALLAAGAGGVYGYSQSVSFRGDYNYEATFWTQMKNGATVAEAIRVMKNTHGNSDPYTNPSAWPIVMSATDAFPANPDGPQNVTCDWRLIGGNNGSAITAVNLSNVNVAVGATAQANLVVNPDNANYTTTWSTYNSSIATVDSNGRVRGVAAGTTTLSVNVYDNVANRNYNRTATITVTGGSTGTSYERVYTIENGGKYIIVADGSTSGSTGYAVGNTAVSNNRYLSAVAVTLNSNGTLSAGSNVDAITWTASGSSASGFSFRNVGNNKYMGLDSAQYLYPSNTAVAWKYTSAYALDNQIDTDGYYYLSYSSGRYTTSKNAGAIRIYKVASGTAPAPTPTYTVTFRDWDGTLLKTQQVQQGGSATPPANPTRPGYTFAGWDRAYTNVTANITVYATYTQNTAPTPTVTYELASYIVPGYKYIMVAENSISGTTGYAVGNTAVSSGRYLTPVRVTVNSDGTLTLPAGTNANAITWTAGGSAYYGYSFRSVGNNKYMGLNSSQYLAPTDSSLAWSNYGGGLDNQIDTDGYYYLSYSSGRYTTSKTFGEIRMYRVVEG